MNKEILNIAKEAGFEQTSLGMTYTSGYLQELLERFYNLVASSCVKPEVMVLEAYRHGYDAGVKEEREICARIADEWATEQQKQFGNGGPGAVIRARN